MNPLWQWFSAPAFKNDEDANRAASLINTIIWVFAASATLYGILAPIEEAARWRRVVIIVPFVITLIALKFLLNRGYIRAAAWAVVTMLWLMLTAAMTFGADYQNPAYMGYIIVVICAGLLLHWRAALAWGAFSILTNAVILYAGENNILPRSDGSTPAIAFWAAQSIYILVCSFLISRSLRKIDEALSKAQYELCERERMEAEREQVIQELESKNAELERFTYTVSHDLKSPLITIGGYLGLLEKDTRAGDIRQIENDINRIREATIKMQDLLSDLLELSRVGRIMNPPEMIPFAEIVSEAALRVEGRLKEKGITLTVQENMPNVYADKIRLIEVIQNLLENAAKFTAADRPAQIEVGVSERGGETAFYVKDNGIGIKPEHHERIFGLFNKLDPSSEGTGLGLALVKRTIEIHGGRIWIESKEGEGATFLFTLKLTAPPQK